MNNYFNSSKTLFFMLMLISTIFSLSSLSMINMWMGMEVNLISFIPIMINYKNNFSSESMMSYFLIQALSSVNFLFSFLMLNYMTNWMNSQFFNNLLIMVVMNLSLLMKMGAAPFHFWFPKTMKGLNWTNCLILSTWQKILPMIALSYCFINFILMTAAFFSALIGAILGLTQTSLQLIMAYSSINHISWMLMALMFSLKIWFTYILIYSILNTVLMFIFKTMKMYNLNQMYSNKSFNLMSYFILFNFLSLSGLPPFIGFLPKWLLINLMAENQFYFLVLFLISMSLINLFFYIRITYSYFLLNFYEIKFFNLQYIYFNLISMITYTSLLGLLICPLIYLLS
uniref:NADH dehydrogenase subunit 2 n=1 Tax=Nothopsyche ruficollis TaxID=115141 RepID=UPI0022DCE40B|nr:NADH dehydrogenase subunit 2 [Nothopsyche ruficollis]UZZ44182.1 NADH dehydrogenase subunit 2 [Nothopsyche ruficollis]